LEKTIAMARYATWVVLVALLSSTGAAAAPLCEQQRVDGKKPEASASQPDGPPRWKWWLHADSRKELRLTDQQSRKIDEVWESYAPKQRERGHELEKLEQALAQTIKENVADVAIVAQQVDKLEKLRAEYNATRTVMIYRMHLLLTPEQRLKVDEMRARMEAERKRQEEERKRQGRGDKR
jgi:Spy/CpxP family protein refolding chaperone